MLGGFLRVEWVEPLMLAGSVWKCVGAGENRISSVARPDSGTQFAEMVRYMMLKPLSLACIAPFPNGHPGCHRAHPISNQTADGKCNRPRAIGPDMQPHCGSVRRKEGETWDKP